MRPAVAVAPATSYPGGVLEGRHRVDELRPPAGGREPVEHPLELVDAHALGVDLHLQGLRFVGAENGHGAGVGRRLGDHDVAGIDQRLADQVDRLLAAGGDDDVVGVGIHALGAHHLADALPGLGEAFGGAVLKRLGRRLLRDPRHLRGEALRWEGRGVGKATGERDHLRPGGDLHQVAHRRGAHHPGARREQPGVALEIAGGGVGAAVARRRRDQLAVGRSIRELGHPASVAQAPSDR